MTANDHVQVSVLGLGAMGHALAAGLVAAGHPMTVWNRSPGRTDGLVERGATAAPTAGAAVRDGELVVVCLVDHVSVHEVLDPIVSDLAGRPLVNLTTTTPDQSPELPRRGPPRPGWTSSTAASWPSRR